MTDEPHTDSLPRSGRNERRLLEVATEAVSLGEQIIEIDAQIAATRTGPGAIDASWASWLTSLHSEWVGAIERLRAEAPESRPVQRAANDLLDSMRPHFVGEFAAGRRDHPWRVPIPPFAAKLVEVSREFDEGTLVDARKVGRHESYRREEEPLLPLTEGQKRVLEFIKTRGPQRGGEVSEATGVALEHVRKWCDDRGALARRGVTKLPHVGYVWREA